jgi:hypothetical protein
VKFSGRVARAAEPGQVVREGSVPQMGVLEVPAIARAFMVPEATMAKRLVRARSKIATARIPYAIPADTELPGRLAAVLAVVYLIATEAHAPTSGHAVEFTGRAATHDVKDKDHWLASSKREEIFGPLGNALAQRAARRVGSRPSCGQQITGHDLLATGRCGTCGRDGCTTAGRVSWT